MFEQEIASIIKFILDNSGNPAPYYYNIPQSFNVPAIYFPTPELTTRGETLTSYAMEYVWFIKYFDRTQERAYGLALRTITAIKSNRNLIPLIGEDGESIGKGLRIHDPVLKILDDGAIQVIASWTSRRPYHEMDSLKMQRFEVSDWQKPELYNTKTISTAMENALETYLKTEQK